MAKCPVAVLHFYLITVCAMNDEYESLLEMYDEIFHFEIFINFMKILKYFKTHFLKYFMKLLIFNIK